MVNEWIWVARNFLAQLLQLLVVQLTVGCCGEESGPWPVNWLLTSTSCRHSSFLCISLICWAYFSDIIILPGFGKCSGSDQQQATKQWSWPFLFCFLVQIWACLVAQMIKNLPAMQETWVKSLGREDSPGGVNGNPLPSSCLENPMDRRSWWATVNGVTRSHTHLTD